MCRCEIEVGMLYFSLNAATKKYYIFTGGKTMNAYGTQKLPKIKITSQKNYKAPHSEVS